MNLSKSVTFTLLLACCLHLASSSFIEESSNGTTLLISAEQSVQINCNLIVNGTVTVNSVNLVAKIQAHEATIQTLQNTVATLNATLMRFIDAAVNCASSPCSNGGSCSQSNQANLFLCSCLAGFTGARCESNVTNACLSNPCLNGGACVAFSNASFACQCVWGYYGAVCAQFNLNSVQWGTSNNDIGISIAIDSSKSMGYITGCTYGAFPGFTLNGTRDVFMSTVDLTSGVVVRTTQWGTNMTDYGYSIAVDSSKSMGYICGYTYGSFPGSILNGTANTDVFLSTVNLTSGAVVQTTQWGTSDNDYGLCIAIDNSKSMGYITGYTYGAFPSFILNGAGTSDLFMSTVNLTSGAVVQITQWGTSGNDYVYSIAIDNSKSMGYITGYTFGAFPGFTANVTSDLFLSTVNLTSGVVVRTTQWGTSGSDVGLSIAIDSSKSMGYIIGWTKGAFFGFTLNGAGTYDSFMSTVNLTSGVVIRTTQWGTSSNDQVYSIAIDSSKSMGYITGYTDGAFPGFTNLGAGGSYDLFMSTVNLTSGVVVRTIQWGTNMTDYGYSIAIDSSKSMGYITGYTQGAFLGFTLNGTQDVFMSTVSLFSP